MQNDPGDPGLIPPQFRNDDPAERVWPPIGPANARREVQPPNEESVSPPSAAPSADRHQLSWVGVGAIALLSALVGGLLAGATVAFFTRGDSDSGQAAPGTTQAVTVEQTSAIAEAAANARPSVVRITSTKRSGQTTEQDVGSGVVLDTDGHILTNAHVVLNTSSLKVTFADGSERSAVMVGHDFPFTDVAVIQVGLGKLTPLPAGDSSRLRLGEAVIAIGNPLAEFDGSVSVGVVSGLSRVRTFDGVRQDDLIQTDAAVNSGNSGGALLNLEGQFVGVPTAVLRQSRSGTSVEGIAFALPSNRALEIAAGIIAAGGQFPRPSLQADHVDLTPETNLRGARPAVRQGAIITTVTSGGAADDAGIQVGDVITKLGDYVLDEEHPLLNGLMPYHAGDTAKVVLNRNGRIIEAEVRFAKRS